MMQVRAAGPDDLEEVAGLFDQYRQFYEQPPDLPLARRFIGERLRDGDSVILLAPGEAGDPAAGFTQLYPIFSSVAARRVFVLNDLFVAAHARRRGVARALLEAARRHAQDAGARGLVLETAADNHAAQALYESLGWEREHGVLHYFLELPREQR